MSTDERAAEDDLGRELALEPSSMMIAVAAEADERRDRHEADGRDRGDAQPGDDRRRRQRRLDASAAGASARSPCRRRRRAPAGGTPSMPATMFRTRISSV